MSLKNTRLSMCKLKETLSVWHRKFARINFEQVKKVLIMNNIRYKEKTDAFCQDCIVGK